MFGAGAVADVHQRSVGSRILNANAGQPRPAWRETWRDHRAAWTDICRPATLALLGLACHKVLISASAFLATSKQDPTVSRLGEQEVEQEGPADIIDWDKSISDPRCTLVVPSPERPICTPMTRPPKVSNRVSP